MKHLFFFLFLATLAVLACQNAPGPAAAQAPIVPAAGRDTVPPVDLDYLTGKFDPAARPDFVRVGRPYTDKAGMMLREEAFAAFERMWKAAQKEGITLKIISSTRTFEQQKGIWEGKWTRFAAETPDPEKRALRILEYSAMPGVSRHHWGTDIDLNDLNNPSFEGKGAHKKVYDWLAEHAHEYGFCQPYTPLTDPHRAGYHEEKWHWSYMRLSQPFLQQYLNLVNDTMISGFSGAELAPGLHIVETYAAGINTACR
ncbi:MAG TPA: M15 family metallopeptidase [Saprospiraceae bacterium]|nr:M15 family metallopeptidase [Saprospiraceae bacterium]HNM23976.1 M15 family metallopeptidase [Saprospiraceae bacterium]